MTEDEILQGIGDIARRSLGWKGPLRREMSLVEDLALDSLRLHTLAVAVEDRFRIYLEEEDEAAIETVGDLLRVIRRKLGS